VKFAYKTLDTKNNYVKLKKVYYPANYSVSIVNVTENSQTALKLKKNHEMKFIKISR